MKNIAGLQLETNDNIPVLLASVVSVLKNDTLIRPLQETGIQWLGCLETIILSCFTNSIPSRYPSVRQGQLWLKPLFIGHNQCACACGYLHRQNILIYKDEREPYGKGWGRKNSRLPGNKFTSEKMQCIDWITCVPGCCYCCWQWFNIYKALSVNKINKKM